MPLDINPLLDNNDKPILRGQDSIERKSEEERISTELEEFSIGSEGLKDPRILCRHSNPENGQSKPPQVIPLETEVCISSPFCFSRFKS